MARIDIPEQDRHISQPDAIRQFLLPFGIHYERWELATRVNPDASPEEILSAYAPEIEQLKKRGGYLTADVINVTPVTPGLDAMLARFNKEHTHAEDEVRFILKGRGLFFIHPKDHPVFALEVEAGDLINVPMGTLHWFDLCAERTIRAIRLFQNPAGWTPTYIENGVHDRFQPVCWNGAELPGEPLKTMQSF